MKDTDLRVVQAWLDQWAARLDESQARIDGVKASIALLDAEARAQVNAQLVALQQKIDRARAKLEEGRSRIEAARRSSPVASAHGQAGTDSTWETFKAGVEALWNDLAQALDQAVTPEQQAGRGALNEDEGKKGSP
jgi:phage shock protein A